MLTSRCKLLKRVVTTTLLTLLASLLFVGPAAIAQTTDDPIEQSIVQTLTEWKGYIQYPDGYGGLKWSDEETAYIGCSGFFVSSKGHIATAGHCVDPEEGRKALIRAFFATLQDKGLPQEAVDTLLPEALAGWKVEGKGTGAPITREVRVTQPIGIGAVLSDDSPVVQVVDFGSAGEDDIALLKLNREGTPALRIAGEKTENGTEVTAIGFPAAVSNAVDASRARASFKAGTISSQQTTGTGVAVTEINADVSEGMSGGPTVNKKTGGVVGVNSFRVKNEGGQAFNFITSQEELASFLRKNGVEMEVASGGILHSWFGILLIVIASVGVCTLVILYVRRIRRSGSMMSEPTITTTRIEVCDHQGNPADAKFCASCGILLSSER